MKIVDKRVFQLTFQRNGKELKMGEEAPYKVLEVQGLEAADFELSLAANGSLPGSSITGVRIAQRQISVTFDTPNSRDFALYRRELIRFFHPLEEIRLIVNYHHTQMEILCRVESFRFATSNLYEHLRGELELLCPQPFFMDLNHYGKNIAAKTPLFAFPLFLPRGWGRAMSYKTLKQNVSLPNAGDVDTGIEVVFRAVRGTVLNPKIEKVDTGEYVQVMLEMAQGEELRIDTNAGKKRIQLNGENKMQAIDRGSSFFAIKPGDNILKYSAEENYTNLDVYLYYTPKYLGV